MKVLSALILTIPFLAFARSPGNPQGRCQKPDYTSFMDSFRNIEETSSNQDIVTHCKKNPDESKCKDSLLELASKSFSFASLKQSPTDSEMSARHFFQCSDRDFTQKGHVDLIKSLNDNSGSYKTQLKDFLSKVGLGKAEIAEILPEKLDLRTPLLCNLAARFFSLLIHADRGLSGKVSADSNPKTFAERLLSVNTGYQGYRLQKHMKKCLSRIKSDENAEKLLKKYEPNEGDENTEKLLKKYEPDEGDDSKGDNGDGTL